MAAQLPSVMLPNWVHYTNLFQDTALMNRAVLDTVGYGIPSVALTRNPTERKEQTLDRILVIGSAFFLAPLHALLLMRYFGRKLPSKELMRVSYKHLKSLPEFKQGLEEVAKNIVRDSRGKKSWTIPEKLLKDDKYADSIRKQLIDAKSHMLLWDLLIEASILMNIKFITNWVTRKKTGKNQHAGEQGVVSADKLDNLYKEYDKKKRFSEKFKQSLGMMMALVISPTVALGLRHAMRHPDKQNVVLKGLRKIADKFDYKRGIYISMLPLGILVGLQYLGYLMAARDKHELREKATVQGIGNYIFFFGNATWMYLLGKTVLRKAKIKPTLGIQENVDRLKKAGKSAPLITKAATGAAAFYWLCFALNNLSFAGLVVGNNHATTKKVKKEAEALAVKQQLEKLAGVGKGPYQPIQRQPWPFVNQSFSQINL
ncbi:MAG: hypothetical protein KTR14_00325 [Vampirovibrio sp.]|nr:hypothetical protein [Vampirovibrio sp.]